MGSPPRWIDSHCHLADPRWANHLPEALARSREQGIGTWIQGGVDPSDWKRQQELRALDPGVVLCFGLHPWWVITRSREELEADLELLKQELPNAAAMGELGLDLSRRLPHPHPSVTDPLEHQLWAFSEQLKLANRKPLVLHVVRAHEEAQKVVATFLHQSRQKLQGIVHTFSGNSTQAKRYLEMGLSISISGGVTQKGFQSLKKTVKVLPPEHLLVETDSPDQPLNGHSGLNEPGRLIQIAEAIAAIRGETAEKVLDRSTENAKRIFGL